MIAAGMKTGCLFAFLTFVAGFFVTALVIYGFGMLFTYVRVNQHHVVEEIGNIWFFVTIGAFIYGFRLQTRWKAQRQAEEPRPPENLRPIDYSRLRKTVEGKSEPEGTATDAREDSN